MKLALIALAALCACGGPSTSQKAQRSPTRDQPIDLIAGIPDNTPYLYAITGSVGDFLRAPKPLALAPLRALASHLEGGDAKLASSDIPEWIVMALAVLPELEGDHLGDEHLAILGIDPHGEAVLFGLGAYPAVRVRVGDPQAARSRLPRILQRLADAWKRPLRFDARSVVWTLAIDDELELVVSLSESALAGALVPAADHTATVERLQASDGPRTLRRDSYLAHTRALALRGSAVGHFHVAELGRVLLAGSRDQECVRELSELLARAPRIWFGLDKRAESIAIDMLVELDPRTTQAFAALTWPVQDLAHAKDSALAVSLGLDTAGVLGELAGLLAALEKQPFQCAELRAIQTTAYMIRQRIDEALDSELAGFRQLYLSLPELSLPFSPRPTAGLLVVEHDAPAALSKLLSLPDDVPQDGTAVAFRHPRWSQLGELLVARKASRTAIAMGARSGIDQAFRDQSGPSTSFLRLHLGELVSQLLSERWHARSARGGEDLASRLIHDVENERSWKVHALQLSSGFQSPGLFTTIELEL